MTHKIYRFSDKNRNVEIDYEEDCFIPEGYLVSLKLTGTQQSIYLRYDDIRSITAALHEVESIIPLKHAV